MIIKADERPQTICFSEKMKIVLLGATGDTGKPLLRQTLEKGHIVTAILREPSKIAVEHADLTTIKVSVSTYW